MLIPACSGKSPKENHMNHNQQNRLVQSQSPYLMQHATNPVDWFPWGDEAFDKAKKENKPIFLSIGYSTCHWCHVMEHESFEDSTVAALMNKHFISIKVDREEMPEVDHVYMSVCQAMTGRGGWPLTIIMTPDKKPFFAGTYFPKDGRGQRPGMLQLLPSIAQAWDKQQNEIQRSIKKITDYLQDMNQTQMGESLDATILDETYLHFANRFDSEMGGFGKAPKFPSPHNLIYLLRFYHMTGESKALEMVELTLRKMRRGGIFDHIGFGFHRYSTDKEWLLPHFEKMLYDQAMIAMAYLDSYHITQKEEYAQTAQEIFTYVLRDMTSPNGGFYSAEDADSDGEEGKFYVWTKEELLDILGETDGELFSSIFSISENGNFKDEATGKHSSSNIPHFSDSKLSIAQNLKMSVSELDSFIHRSRQKLFTVREKRIHPLKDDKILTDWNGLMIAALSLGGQLLNEPKYTKAAEKSAHFILTELRDKNGRLKKRFRNGISGIDAHLDDYAFMIWGLLNLYETTYNVEWLTAAIDLAHMMEEEFYDDVGGGFYLGSKKAEKLIVRAKDTYDGAIPAGNSVAAMNCLRLGKMTGQSRWINLGEDTFKAFSGQIKRAPTGHAYLLTSFLFDFNAPKEIVVVGNDTPETKTILNKLSSIYAPNKVILFKDANKGKSLVDLAPWTENHVMINDKSTIYFCENYACQQPTNNVDNIISLLEFKLLKSFYQSRILYNNP